MSSEYDPLFSADEPADAVREGAEAVRRTFAAASRPFLSSPLPWVAWGLLLPAAALVTPAVAGSFAGLVGALFLWAATVLVGGAIESLVLRRRRAAAGRSPLAAWALRVQGNLSLAMVAISAALLWAGEADLLPGLWLLLLGHSFFTLGGLSFPPMRAAGIVFQLGGLAALWPDSPALEIFAATAAAGCAVMAVAIWRRAD